MRGHRREAWQHPFQEGAAQVSQFPIVARAEGDDQDHGLSSVRPKPSTARALATGALAVPCLMRIGARSYRTAAPEERPVIAISRQAYRGIRG